MKLRAASLRWIVSLLLVAVGVGLFLRDYRRLQADERVEITYVLPPQEITPLEGHAFSWTIPQAKRFHRWHRLGVRLEEDGSPLSGRVEDQGLVATLGQGRFVANGGTIAFSARDNSHPGQNGKQYRLRVGVPSYRAGVWAMVWLTASVLVLLLCPPWRSQVGEWFFPPRHSGRPRLVLAVGGWLIALVLALFPWAQFNWPLRLAIPPECLVQHREGVFTYSLPRWVHWDGFRMDSLVVSENSTPLRLVLGRELDPQTERGCFTWESGVLKFVSLDGTNPLTNGCAYAMRVPFFTPQAVGWLVWLIAGAGLIVSMPASFWPYLRVRPPWRDTILWPGAILALMLVRVGMTAGQEVVAMTADASLYASAAVRGLGGAELTYHPSGFPWVAGMVALLGLPWRLALDLLYLAAAHFLARSLRELVPVKLATLVLFATLAWHPWPFSGFNFFMSEPLVLLLQMLALGLMFRALIRRPEQPSWPLPLLIGLVLFYWSWTRYEEALIYANGLAFAALALAVDRYRRIPWSFNRVLQLLTPIGIVLVLGLAGKWLNYTRTGIYAKSAISSPGLMRLMRTLYWIQPEQALRFAPVTRQSLSRACEVSPTLRTFQKELLDPQSPAIQVGETLTRVPGEFGPYLNWLLPQALPFDKRLANRLMLQAANEVRQALRNGQLPSRRAFFPLDPDWRVWIKALPDRVLYRLHELAFCLPDSEAENPSVFGLHQKVFDEAANRRAAYAYPRRWEGKGTIPSFQNEVDSVAMLDAAGHLVCGTQLTADPVTNSASFQFQIPIQAPPTPPIRLVFLSQGQVKRSFVCQVTGKATFPWPTPDGVSTGNVNLQWIEFDKQSVAPAVRRALTRFYHPGVFCLLAVLLAWVAKRSGCHRSEPGIILACAALLCFWIANRVLFYALLDVNTGWTCPRYVQCIAPLFPIFLFLLAFSLIKKEPIPSPQIQKKN